MTSRSPSVTGDDVDGDADASVCPAEFPFPLEIWGEATAPSAGAVERVKVSRAAHGFLLLTFERGREYDLWLETSAEIEAALAALAVRWPTQADGDRRAR